MMPIQLTQCTCLYWIFTVYFLEYISATHLQCHINHYQVEAETIRNATADSEFIYRIFQPVIYAEFRRRVDHSLLMTTSRGPLITAENFLEWSFFLGSDNLFGLGDLHLKPGSKATLLNNETTSAIPVILAFSKLLNVQIWLQKTQISLAKL